MKPMYSHVLIKGSITHTIAPKDGLLNGRGMSRSIHCWHFIYKGPEPSAHQHDP